MTALGEELKHIIAEEGPVTVERYMALCASHPRFGYYTTRDPFGPGGDFITAPEVSQMFGELIGLWAGEVWRLMGAPARLRLVELGPGRGTLMADALRAARVVPGFLEALDVHLVEASPVLRTRQATALDAAGPPLAWHGEFGTVPAGPLIVLANEFFDALPVRQFERTGRGWCERLVGLDAAGDLAFGLAAEPDRAIGTAAAGGAVLELAPARLALMTRVAHRLAAEGGAALVIDYGHARSALGETLQAVARHAFVDPLAEPGETDLTAHVDFAALARAALPAGVAVHGPVSQADFLTSLGLQARAEVLARRATPAEREAIGAARARLAGTEPVDMGGLFKAMGVAHAALERLPGFPARCRADAARDRADPLGESALP